MIIKTMTFQSGSNGRYSIREKVEEFLHTSDPYVRLEAINYSSRASLQWTIHQAIAGTHLEKKVTCICYKDQLYLVKKRYITPSKTVWFYKSAPAKFKTFITNFVSSPDTTCVKIVSDEYSSLCGLKNAVEAQLPARYKKRFLLKEKNGELLLLKLRPDTFSENSSSISKEEKIIEKASPIEIKKEEKIIGSTPALTTSLKSNSDLFKDLKALWTIAYENGIVKKLDSSGLFVDVLNTMLEKLSTPIELINFKDYAICMSQIDSELSTKAISGLIENRVNELLAVN